MEGSIGSTINSVNRINDSTAARMTVNSSEVVSILFHTSSASNKHTIDIMVSK